MGTAADRRTVGFGAVMKRLHYAWIIVSVTFLILLAVQGVRLSFGAFVEPWERQFSMDRSTISLISTVSFIVYGISQPVIGRLVDKWGARAVLAWSALLTGVSIFLTYLVTSPWQTRFCFMGWVSRLEWAEHRMWRQVYWSSIGSAKSGD